MFSTTFVQAQSAKFPKNCRKILDNKFRGWKFAEIQSDIEKYFKEIHSKDKPNLLSGDWNGDGKTDYAVLIEYGKLRNHMGEVIGNRRLLIPFIHTSKGVRHFVFEGSEYISVNKKGSKGYNYDSGKFFHFKTDSIFDGFFEKAGVSYIWNKSKFRVVTTSD
ncbi:MAG: hypothetical protein WBD16_14185 [Pyrinomonadaceae bacterium]